MPSQRKRIGFLPRTKVTGILVEEALTSRGILNTSKINIFNELDSISNNSLSISNDNFNNKILKENINHNLNERNIRDEVQMINDFIEFKLFKNIMNKNKRNIL